MMLVLLLRKAARPGRECREGRIRESRDWARSGLSEVGEAKDGSTNRWRRGQRFNMARRSVCDGTSNPS